MRICALLGMAIGLAFIGLSRVDAGKEAKADRVADLSRQLGHEEFAKREAASRELDAIGAPALDALRKAASHDDPEVRRRAEQILQAVTGRIRHLPDDANATQLPATSYLSAATAYVSLPMPYDTELTLGGGVAAWPRSARVGLVSVAIAGMVALGFVTGLRG